MTTQPTSNGAPTPKLSPFFYLSMAVLGLGFGLGFFGLVKGDWLTGGVLFGLILVITIVAYLLDNGILPGEQRRLMQAWKKRNATEQAAEKRSTGRPFYAISLPLLYLLLPFPEPALAVAVLLWYGVGAWRRNRQPQRRPQVEYDNHGHE